MTWSLETTAACSLDSLALVEEDWVSLKVFLFSVLASGFSAPLDNKILAKATVIYDHRVTLTSALAAILTSHGSRHSGLCILAVATLSTSLCIAEESL